MAFIFGRGESPEWECVIDSNAMWGKREMRSHWKEIVIGILVMSLSTVIVNWTIAYNKYVATYGELTQVRQTLVNQTQLIVELRQKLVPKNFASLDELTRWVDDWEVDNKPIVVSILNKTFVVTGNTELYSQYWDCDDISEAMQRDALKDGYLMSVALVSVSGVTLDHAVNMAVVGNAFYLVEPQTGKIEFTAGRD